MGHIWNVCKVSGIRAMPSHVNNQKLQPRFQLVSGPRSRVSYLRSCTIDQQPLLYVCMNVCACVRACVIRTRIPGRSFLPAPSLLLVISFGHYCPIARSSNCSLNRITCRDVIIINVINKIVCEICKISAHTVERRNTLADSWMHRLTTGRERERYIYLLQKNSADACMLSAHGYA